MKSTISIITTCYNAGATIRATIESVLSQRGDFELEHIITDAGSKDDTLSIIAEYKDKLRLIPVPGLNQSAGINAGIAQAKGNIIAYLNADDLYEPGALAKVAQAFEANPTKRWLAGYCRIIDEKGVEQQKWITAYKNLLLGFYRYGLLLTENFICQPAVFLRREVLETYGPFSEHLHYVMDYEYWLRIGKHEDPIVVRDYLASFRRFAGTKSNSGFVQQFKDDRSVARRYAVDTAHYWTIPLKYLNYLKTVGIYKLLYR